MAANTQFGAPPPGYTYDASGNLVPIGSNPAPGLFPGQTYPGEPTGPTGGYAPPNALTPPQTSTTPPAGSLPATSGSAPPPGYHLDPNSGSYVPDNAPAATPPPSGGGGGGTTTTNPGITGLTLGPPAPSPSFPGFNPLPSYTPPPAFQAPSVQDALNNPGYQFTVQQGQNALQNWAAAKGVLNDSDTAQNLIQFGQQSAEGDYQNVFNNDLSAYNTNYATQYTDPYAIAAQRANTGNANIQTTWQDAYNAWLASNQLLQGEQGLVIQGSNAGL